MTNKLKVGDVVYVFHDGEIKKGHIVSTPDSPTYEGDDIFHVRLFDCDAPAWEVSREIPVCTLNIFCDLTEAIYHFFLWRQRQTAGLVSRAMSKYRGDES